VHAGALSAPWGPFREFHAANVEGTKVVLAGCIQNRVRRLVHISSPSVVFDGRDLHEATEQVRYPRRLTSHYSLTKKLGEDLVNAASSQGLERVILRPKAIFGPEDTTLLPRILAAAEKGRLVQIGDGKNLVDLTYVDNVVQAILLAIETPGIDGRTYTITNDEHVPLWSVIRQTLEHFGMNSRLKAVHPRAALFAAFLMAGLSRLNGREPSLTRHSVLVLACTQTYDIGAARNELGYVPRVSIADGLERTLRGMERSHVL
jgi:nucleoside-diphosphate-sugar epimerase